MKILSNVDYAKNQGLNQVFQNLAAAPSSPVNGQVYYDTVLGQVGAYQNGTWIYLSAGVSNALTRAAAAANAGELIVSGGADRTAAGFTTAGLLKIASGVVAAAVAGTDYVTAGSTNTFTNKTFDAAGTGNSLTNISTAMFAAGVIDTDTTLAANSDTRLASQKAVKAYVLSLVTNGMHVVGSLDASANPNFPAATIGDLYKISVGGKVGGASGQVVSAGDSILAIATTAAGTDAAVGANWDVIQANVEQATASTLGLVQLATSTEAEAKSNTVKALTPSAVVNFPVKKTFTIGDGTTTAIVVTHNLGTQDIIIGVRDASTNVAVLVDYTATSTSTATLTFSVAPATNAYKVVVVG